jgi:hypothetical protein
MDTNRIEQAIENGLVEKIRKGDLFEVPYNERVNIGPELRKAYERIDYNKVYARITELLEEELARKVVNKIITEMGTDIKKLMENATVREDFRFLMRSGVTEILKKVKE